MYPNYNQPQTPNPPNPQPSAPAPQWFPGYPGGGAPPFHASPPPRPRRNKWVIVGILAVGVPLAVLGVGAMVYRGVTDPHGNAELRDLTVGRCVDRSQTGDTVYSLPTRSCSKPHDGEVLYIGDLPTWNGENSVAAQAKDSCLRVERQLPGGTAVDVQAYSPPDEQAWKKWPKMMCVGWAKDGKLTDSISAK